jgi:hypothetical protein
MSGAQRNPLWLSKLLHNAPSWKMVACGFLEAFLLAPAYLCFLFAANRPHGLR